MASIAILLTYKNKLLLTCSDIDPLKTNQYPWGFIEGQKTKAESFDQAVNKKVLFTTQLLVNTMLILTRTDIDNNEEQYYHGNLDDQQVNRLKRRSGQRLEFFTLADLKKMSLSMQTNNFLQANTQLVQSLLA